MKYFSHFYTWLCELILLLIIKTFQEKTNGIHFAYNEGVEIKWKGGIFLKIRKVGGGGGS